MGLNPGYIPIFLLLYLKDFKQTKTIWTGHIAQALACLPSVLWSEWISSKTLALSLSNRTWGKILSSPMSSISTSEKVPITFLGYKRKKGGKRVVEE